MGVHVRLIGIGIVLAVGINFAFKILEFKSEGVFSDHHVHDLRHFFEEAHGIGKHEYSIATSTLRGIGSHRAVSRALQTSRLYRECQGKERFLALMYSAIPDEEISINQTAEKCSTFPIWSETVELYGDRPIVIGMETCHAYRNVLKGRRPLIRWAGLQNSGTNALKRALTKNLPDVSVKRLNSQYMDKHVPLKFWYNNTRFNGKNQRYYLSVIIVRDPFRWANSMCKTPYNAKWAREEGHCPNLLHDNGVRGGSRTPIPVSNAPGALFAHLTTNHTSMMHLWSDWNKEYYDATFPNLIVRLEDLLFHPEQTLEYVANCTGTKQSELHQYDLEAAKTHGNPADYILGLTKYGTGQGRYGGLTREEFIWAEKEALDPTLMKVFGYSSGPGPA